MTRMCAEGGQLAVAIDLADRRVLLDRQVGVARVEERVVEDLVGLGQRFVHIAEHEMDAFVDVALFAVVVDAWLRMRQRLLRTGDRSQWLVIDVDPLQSVRRGRLVHGDDRGHRVTDEAYALTADRLFVLADREDAEFDGHVGPC
jgi:hypothetical protein